MRGKERVRPRRGARMGRRKNEWRSGEEGCTIDADLVKFRAICKLSMMMMIELE